MTLLSPSDDELPLLIQEYNDMDPYLRSEFLEALGTTRAGWKSKVAAYERRRGAERGRRSSTDTPQEKGSPSGSVSARPPVLRAVVVVGLPQTFEHIEFLLLGVDGDEGARSRRRYRSAPPARGFAAAGPGRSRSGSSRRAASQGSPGVPLVRIVIMMSEE